MQVHPQVGIETLPQMLKVQVVQINSEITMKSNDKKMLMTERANTGNRLTIDGPKLVQNLVELTQSPFTFSKLTIETLEKGVKHVQR